MSDRPDSARTARIQVLHEARAREELLSAEAFAPGSDVVAWSGALLAEVALVKGFPGAAETSGGAALSGADGVALEKALIALGWAADSWFATLARPEASIKPQARAQRLRAQLEAVDPRVIIALDREAAMDVSAAFETEPLSFGKPIRSLGRRIVAVDGFEASLSDDGQKRLVWQQLQACSPDGPVY